MQIGTKEHYDIITNFEQNYRYERLDKESKDLWIKGIIYADGAVNKLYEAYMLGYSLGRLNYMQSEEKMEG